MNHYQIKNNQLTFTDGRFYLDEQGNHFPSVTTILEAYPKTYQFYEWLKANGDNADKVRDAAGERGSSVHDLTEKYDNGLEVCLLNENNNPQYSLEAWSMFERYVNFSERYNPQHLLVEQNFIGNGYAGTIDRVTTIEGKTYILDIKTANSLYDSYWLQLAAYRKLYNKEVDGVAILWLNAKTRTDKDFQGKGWQLVTKEDTTKEYKLFEATKLLWDEVNAGSKPKEFSYQIKFKK